MSTRTETDASGVTWRVRDIGPGLTQWTRVSGSSPLYRLGGPCELLDRPAARSRPAASRTRSAASSRTASPPRVDRVVLRPAARQQIIEELASWDAGPDESRETGGHLIGYLDGSELIVTAAFGPGPNAVRAYGMLRLDLGYTDSVRHACLDGEVVCGLWHSHPDRSGPSRQDLFHFAGEARYFSKRSLNFRTPLYAGLIATRKGTDWAFPEFAAYLSRGDDFYAEQIELEEEEQWRD